MLRNNLNCGLYSKIGVEIQIVALYDISNQDNLCEVVVCFKQVEWN